MRHGFIFSCIAITAIALFSHVANAATRSDFGALPSNADQDEGFPDASGTYLLTVDDYLPFVTMVEKVTPEQRVTPVATSISSDATATAITFQDVPEPSTWLTLLAGCGAIGLALSRRMSAHAASA